MCCEQAKQLSRSKALVTTKIFWMAIKLAQEPNTQTNEASATILVSFVYKTCVELL
ncbi:hypothetical protein HanXRQr2_Chr07g0311061 [Helianthus annuus]|uniref:Uncharacterized protein n=1 Tax=Helianthus annuus TaxID=4232 RepID=A0A9K3NHS8_HELAN|nr:hypothetical protein HanXRQr2_Chr07g0311061 [Helianthus annuus]